MSIGDNGGGGFGGAAGELLGDFVGAYGGIGSYGGFSGYDWGSYDWGDYDDSYGGYEYYGQSIQVNR